MDESCTPQVVLAANGKLGVWGLMLQSFEACMYRVCKISSIHRRAEALLRLCTPTNVMSSDWKLTVRTHPFLGCLDSGHTARQFSPSTVDANYSQHCQNIGKPSIWLF